MQDITEKQHRTLHACHSGPIRKLRVVLSDGMQATGLAKEC